MEEREYILGFNLIKGITPKIYYEIYTYFQSIEELYNGGIQQLKSCPILSKSHISELINHRKLGVLASHLDILKKKKIQYVSIIDNDYPDILKHIHNPPPILYYKGNIQEDLFHHCISIVGSRKASYYGLKMSEKTAYELSKGDITVVSGLARGIDTTAHVGALKAQGRTIAVLGNGVDVAYPKENKHLYHRIAETGLILSEFPPGTPPMAYNFPRRNRIISGLSMGTVIIEASLKSGSLITAKYALEQGREVYALPGNVNNLNSMGTNALIREGAKIVLETKDILNDIFPMFSFETQRNREDEASLSEEEKMILQCIKLGYNDANKIYQKCDYSIPGINAILTTLEIKNKILIHKGNYFIK
ncbi:MAG: DNA-processing protein DprA [Eubacteriales bacterium]